MPSTYTQNLGIERPATGEQANAWGDTVNRNMDTLDTAINGNVQLTLAPSPYPLAISDGADSPVAANRLIIWTGAQTQQATVQIDWQASRQHLYIMSNQTSGGFAIAFAQGSGSQFVLQAGYDAVIYADGKGTTAGVSAALANPQFNNLLVTGAAQFNNLQVTGSINGVLSLDAQGNVHLAGGLGAGNPGAIPDPVTINGVGVGGQLRLVYGNYGVIFRNDGSTFYLMVTNAGDPYGGWAVSWPMGINLASKYVGLGGWVPDGTYALNVPSIHTGGIRVDGAFSVNGGRSYFNSGDAYAIGVDYGGTVNFIGVNSSGQFQISNAGGGALLFLDGSGNAQTAGTLTANGLIHAISGGIMFPDGTIQTTVARGVTNFQSGGHALGTDYQNTTGKSMWVMVSAYLWSVPDQLTAYCDGNGHPGTMVAQSGTNSTNVFAVTFFINFIVLPGYYYRVDAQAANLVSWSEWY